MPQLLCRFDDPGACAGWAAIDDRVMGGVSRSRLRHDAAGHAVFEGEVSLARGGGFASVRSPPGLAGLAGATDCLIEVRGAARRYKLGLFTAAGFDVPVYQAAFVPDPDAWTTLRLPLAGFVARWRGRALSDAPALDAARVCQAGLLVADGQAGPFALAIRSIALA